MPETPLDPKHKGSAGNSWFLSEARLAGRKRSRNTEIPEGFVDFLRVNGQGELIVQIDPKVVGLLTEIRDQLKMLNEAALRWR